MTSQPGPDTEAIELVRRIRAGDRLAETELIKRYSRPLMKAINCRVRDRMKAEDIHQETFIVVIERLRGEGINEPAKLANFIHKTALNIGTGDFRRDRRRDTIVDSELIELMQDTARSPLDLLLEQEGKELVQTLLQELVPRDREILQRILLGELKSVTCAALEIDKEHYDRVKHRAIERLKALVARRLRDLKPKE